PPIKTMAIAISVGARNRRSTKPSRTPFRRPIRFQSSSRWRAGRNCRSCPLLFKGAIPRIILERHTDCPILGSARRVPPRSDIGLYREPETFVAVEYFFKAPSDLSERLVIVVVPILATANTAVAAVDRLKERGGKEIRLVCLISAPQGIERMRGAHPDGPIWRGGIDETLAERGA